MTTHVAKGVSVHKGQKVYDLQIVKYIGFDNYCRLRKTAPHLYHDYNECWTEPKMPADPEALTMELTSETLKQQLVVAILDGTKTRSTDLLAIKPKKSCKSSPESNANVARRINSPQRLYLQTTVMGTIWWCLWLFVILAFVVFYLIYAGLVDQFFSNNHSICSTYGSPFIAPY